MLKRQRKIKRICNKIQYLSVSILIGTMSAFGITTGLFWLLNIGINQNTYDLFGKLLVSASIVITLVISCHTFRTIDFSR